jgi:Skp family chaperone for outer membrane proteins
LIEAFSLPLSLLLLLHMCSRALQAAEDAMQALQAEMEETLSRRQQLQHEAESTILTHSVPLLPHALSDASSEREEELSKEKDMVQSFVSALEAYERHEGEQTREQLSARIDSLQQTGVRLHAHTER